MPQHFALYLALTATRICEPADLLALGMASHYVPSERVAALRHQMVTCNLDGRAPRAVLAGAVLACDASAVHSGASMARQTSALSLAQPLHHCRRHRNLCQVAHAGTFCTCGAEAPRVRAHLRVASTPWASKANYWSAHPTFIVSLQICWMSTASIHKRRRSL